MVITVLGTGCASICPPLSAEGKLRHVVLFKFKDNAAEAGVKAVEDGFRALPGKISEIKDFEWGRDCSSEGLHQEFTHCFLVTFDDAKGREAYLPHKSHKEFVELLKPSLDKVLVIDYVAGK
jgi:stress responsive alpha/beta barrel protein